MCQMLEMLMLFLVFRGASGPERRRKTLILLRVFKVFHDRVLLLSKRCFPNAVSIILGAISAFCLQTALDSTGFIRVFATHFASAQNSVLLTVFKVFCVRVLPLWKHCFPNAFSMILSAISAFCLQKALNSTGFIRYSGKPGGHVPNAENPNAFLSIPECPCSRAPWPGRAEISKIEGGGFLFGICNIGHFLEKV